MEEEECQMIFYMKVITIEKEIEYIDFFGGAGGFSCGLEESSQPRTKESWPNGSNSEQDTRRRTITFNCIGYYEWDKYAVQTYNKNFGTNYKPTDITKTPSDDIPKHDLLCAGFPCQSFSLAGNRGGFNDTRGTLFFEVARILRDKKPKMFLLENVRGLLSHDGGRTFGIILNTLRELGYVGQYEVLNSKGFGVPHNRERVFIFGIREGRCPKVFPIGKRCEATNEEAAGCLVSSYYKGPARERTFVLNTATKEGRCIAKEGDGVRLQYPESQTARGRVIKGCSQSLQTSDSVGTIQNGKIRRLTPIECERIQGFPDNWTAGVSDTQRYRQMGNAVTVNVIKAIGERLIECLN